MLVRSVRVSMLRRWLVIALLVAGALAAVVVVRLDRRVQAYLRGPALGSIRIFAAPMVVRPGAGPGRDDLLVALARLGYVEGRAPLGPGEFEPTRDGVAVQQRPSTVPWGTVPRHALVVAGKSAVTAIRDLDGGMDPPRLELEPELLATGGGGGSQLEAAERVPKPCRDAVLAAEDQRFFQHPGVDPLALVRATLVNLRAGGAEQGGSTLTQQLVKNTFLTPRRTVGRKLREAVLAVLLELRTSKEDILGRYLASVYLGTDGGVPVHGFAHAAAVHLGKPLGALDVGDCALLAGMIRSPNRLAPRRHRDEARGRRDEVLRLMIERDMIDPETGDKAMAQPVTPAPPRERSVGALYVADQVQRELDALLPEVAMSPGLAVYTSIDATAQRQAERAVRHGLEALERGRPSRDDTLQAALVAIDPESGLVRALVGGRDYRTSALDHAVRMRRQPGSTFKPFVFLTALDPARTGVDARSVVSRIDDRPLTVDVDGHSWSPANYDDEYLGQVALEEALARSLNTATVRLALAVGIGPIVDTARDLGITSPLPPVPALALGAGEVSLLELTAAYGVFASGGLQRPPGLVTAVASGEGEVLYVAQGETRQVIDPAVAYLMTHMLERAIDAGTGDGVRRAGFRGAAAGKTGTTNDMRDAWFVGWTPDLVAGVWVGYDRGGSTGLTGARGALPIWTTFIRATAGATPPAEFPVPAGIVWRDVDPTTGLLATPSCPQVSKEPFLAGSEPPAACDRHRPTWAAVTDEIEETARDTGKVVESTGRSIGRFFRELFD